jgi:protochlorophyllide reductase
MNKSRAKQNVTGLMILLSCFLGRIQTFLFTVGINHFGHVYLNQLLLDANLLSPTAHIVVTASGVHDPASPGGAQGELATLGQLTGLERQGRSCQMIDGGSFNADKAYKDSKV